MPIHGQVPEVDPAPVQTYQQYPKAERVVDKVTANGTSGVFRLPGGPKSFYAEVVGVGAVTQTVVIYGTPYATPANGIELGTITLTATTRDQDALPVITCTFPWYYCVFSNTTGTAATGAVYAMY